MEVKGTAIKNTVDWINKNYDINKVDSIFKKLPLEHQTYFPDNKIFVSKWYPFHVFMEFNKLIISELGKGSINIIYDIAREGAKDNIRTIYKSFFKILSPYFIAKKCATIYSQYYNFGVMNLKNLENNNILISVDGIIEDKIFFERIAGFVTGIMELTKVDDVNVSYRYDAESKSVLYNITFK